MATTIDAEFFLAPESIPGTWTKAVYRRKRDFDDLVREEIDAWARHALASTGFGAPEAAAFASDDAPGKAGERDPRAVLKWIPGL